MTTCETFASRMSFLLRACSRESKNMSASSPSTHRRYADEEKLTDKFSHSSFDQCDGISPELEDLLEDDMFS